MGVAAALAVKISANVLDFEKDIKSIQTGVADLGKKIEANNKPAGNLVATFGTLAKVAAGLGVAKLVTDFIAAASSLNDLSAQTAIGTKELQRLQYAGDLVGISIEQIASGASMLQKRLGGGEASAVGAIRELGLNFADLEQLDPGAQFEVIATEIGKIPDPLKRAAIAADLFGRAGTQFLPLFRSDMKALGDEAELLGAVIGDDLIRGADELGDAWSRLMLIGQGLLGRALRPLLEHASRLPLEISRLKALLEGDWAGAITGQLEMPTPTAPSGLTPGQLPALGMSPGEARALESELNAQIKQQQAAAEAWQKELDRLSGREAIKTAAEWQRKVAQIGGVTKLTADDTKAFADALWEAVLAMQRLGTGTGDQAIKSLQQWASLQKAELSTGLVGVKDRFGITQEMPGGLKMITQLSAETEKEVQLLGILRDEVQSTIGVMGQFGTLGPELILQPLEMAALSSQTLRDNAQAIKMHFESMPSLVDKVFGGTTGIGVSFGNAIVSGLLASGERMKAFLMTLGQGFGNSIASFLSAALKKALESTTGFFSQGLGKLLGGALGSLIPVIGDLLGPLIGKIAGLFDRDKGRDVVESFASQFGGFDALHAKLLTLGDAGEQLWIKLTQGVGRNNPQQAQAAIEQINAALANAPASMTEQAASAGFQTNAQLEANAQQAVALWEFMRDSGQYSALAVQQAWERANQALIASGDQQALAAQNAQQQIAALDEQIKSLTASIAAEAPEEVMGVIERQQREQLAALEAQREQAQANMLQLTAEGAAGVQSIIDQLNGQEVVIPVHFKYDTGPLPPGEWNTPGAMQPSEVPEMAAGGIVRSRRGGTLVNVGEGGSDEAIVPLESAGIGGNGAQSVIIFEMDGERWARAVVPYIPGEVQRYGAS